MQQIQISMKSSHASNIVDTQLAVGPSFSLLIFIAVVNIHVGLHVGVVVIIGLYRLVTFVYVFYCRPCLYFLIVFLSFI